MRLFYAALSIITLSKTSLAWNCDARCPMDSYIECLEYEAKNGNRQLIDNAENVDKDQFDWYEQQEPETLDMSSLRSSSLRGSQQSRARQLEETLFQLRLYHEEGYCWQAEWEDRGWCAECRGECEESDYLELQRCDANETKQYFVYEPMPVGGRIKPTTNISLCWERTRVNAHQLKPCDDIVGVVNVTQIFRDFSFSDKFELHPFNRGGNTSHPDGPMCLSNHHHPKREEVIRAEPCTTARADNSSFWIVVADGMEQEEGIDDSTILPSSWATEIPSEAPSEELLTSLSSAVPSYGASSWPSSAPVVWTTPTPSQPTKWPTAAPVTPSPIVMPTDSPSQAAVTEAPQEPTRWPTAPPVTQAPSVESVETEKASEIPIQDWGWNGCSVFIKCPQCAGDCDMDDECEGNLICYKKPPNGNVPTCSGGESIQHEKDFCIPPDWNTRS